MEDTAGARPGALSSLLMNFFASNVKRSQEPKRASYADIT